jgi:CubicO group peptidase (beta-lactamase class C family)
MTRFSPALLATVAAMFGLLLGGPPEVWAQIGPDTAARIDSVFADVDRRNGPGCAVGVTQAGQLAYAEGYGRANLDYRRPITPETVFDTASLSKQFTAAAVVLAARQGHLSLDDPVRKWLPELPDYDSGPITLRHLIHHTSGLRDNYNLAALAGWENLDAHDTDEYLTLIYRQEGLNFDPGTDSGYSNTNYILLAEIVEAATGRSLRAFAEEHLFTPLGMDDTHFHDNRNEVVRNRAVGYRQTEQGFVMNHPWDYEIVGSGGVYSTVEDLARWSRNFETETVGGEGFAEQMTTRGRLADGDTLGYAFGLRVGDYRGRRTVEHGGTLEGFRAQYVRFPDDDRSVIVLCNTRVNPKRRANAVADLVLPGPLAPRAGGRPDPGESGADLSTDVLDAYTGLYRAPADGYFRFAVENGRLMAERSMAFRIPLRPVTRRRFTAPGPIDSLIFSPSEAETPRRVDVVRSTGTTSFRRVFPVSYSPAERKAFTGCYHSDELGVDYRVRIRDGALQIVRADGGTVRLQPGVRDEFRLDGGFVRFERSDAGEVVAFEWNTRRVAGLRFERRP